MPSGEKSVGKPVASKVLNGVTLFGYRRAVVRRRISYGDCDERMRGGAFGRGGLSRFPDRKSRKQLPEAYHVGRYVAAGDDEGDGQKKTAVTGSNAPRMAVGVDPMY